jgi:hypothetical protein
MPKKFEAMKIAGGPPKMKLWFSTAERPLSADLKGRNGSAWRPPRGGGLPKPVRCCRW